MKVNPTPQMRQLYWAVVNDFRTLLALIETKSGTRH